MKNKLIYIMDTQCGWCYGNAQNITTFYNNNKENFDFEFLNGGMWIGDNAPVAGTSINKYISTHLPRLEAYTGVKISDAYKNLIVNSDYILSSLEPSAAIVLLKKLAPKKVFEIAKDIQKIYFTQGKRLDDLDTYLPILEEYSISKEIFKSKWLSKENLSDSYLEFEKAKKLANGFPTFLVQTKEGITKLTSGYFELEIMQNQLDKLI